MKRSLLVLISLFALVLAGPVACKKKEQVEPLQGSWIIDSDATLDQLSDEDRQMASMVIGMLRLGFDFQEGGRLEIHTAMMGQKEQGNGTWKILEKNDKEYTLEVTREAAPELEIEADSTKLTVTFLENDKIRFRPIAQDGETAEELDRETLVLKRVSKEEFLASMESSGEMNLEQLLGGGGGLELIPSDEHEGHDHGEEAPVVDEDESDEPAADAE